VPEYDYIAFPSAGYMPTTFFVAAAPWSVSVNFHKFKPPTEANLKIAVYPLQPSGGLPDPTRRGPALELDSVHVAFGGKTTDGDMDFAIIFHPKNLNLKGPSTRFWVEITGLKKSDGADTKIEYLVDFCAL
jgi:hypothetical protein